MPESWSESASATQPGASRPRRGRHGGSSRGARAQRRQPWREVPVDPVPQVRPGLVVYRWGGSLYFANSARFEEQVTGLAEPHRKPVKWLCVDVVAIGEIDYTGGEMLIQVNNELKERGVRFVCSSSLR
jgi:MFS superfamily sulfate permease-like transporter